MPGTAWCAGTIALMLPFFAGVVAGISAAALLIIVLAPSRRVRAETRLDREVETRLLLGVDPELDPLAEPADVEESRPDFGAAELQALRQLDSERTGQRKSRRR
jgi:hypothetical protein